MPLFVHTTIILRHSLRWSNPPFFRGGHCRSLLLNILQALMAPAQTKLGNTTTLRLLLEPKCTVQAVKRILHSNGRSSFQPCPCPSACVTKTEQCGLAAVLGDFLGRSGHF